MTPNIFKILIDSKTRGNLGLSFGDLWKNIISKSKKIWVIIKKEDQREGKSEWHM